MPSFVEYTGNSLLNTISDWEVISSCSVSLQQIVRLREVVVFLPMPSVQEIPYIKFRLNLIEGD